MSHKIKYKFSLLMTLLIYGVVFIPIIALYNNDLKLDAFYYSGIMVILYVILSKKVYLKIYKKNNYIFLEKVLYRSEKEIVLERDVIKISSFLKMDCEYKRLSRGGYDGFDLILRYYDSITNKVTIRKINTNYGLKVLTPSDSRLLFDQIVKMIFNKTTTLPRRHSRKYFKKRRWASFFYTVINGAKTNLLLLFLIKSSSK